MRILILILFVFNVYAKDILLVGVNPFPPMDIYNETTKTFSGFDVDLWSAIAAKADLQYRFQVVPEFNTLIPLIKDKELDVGLAGITINSVREKIIDFSHKYFKSGLGIVVRADKEASFITKLKLVLNITKSTIPFFLMFLVFTFFVAIAFWLLERKINDKLGQKFYTGNFNCWYWANVVLATVGFGDITPVSKRGKFFCVVLMWLGIFFIVPFITANITAQLTSQRITGFIINKYDLKGKQVAVEKGSTSISAVENLDGIIVEVKDAFQGCKSLQQKTVDAFVCDIPVAKYLSKKNKDLLTVPEIFDEQDYGIALQLGSPYRKKINEALLKLQENGVYDSLYQKYFGNEE